MLKTQSRTNPQASGKLRSKAKSKALTKRAVKLTPEQQDRADAFRKMTAKWQRDWDAMTPEQQHESEESWKRAMNRMNEDRRQSGQRLLFLEEIK